MTEEGPVTPKKREDTTEFGGLRVVWLEAFVLSARTRTRVEVAAQMGIDQATVTKHIKKLEAWLASGRFRPLLDDNIWPTHLTDAGKAFLPQAEMVLDLLRQSRVEPMEILKVDPSEIKLRLKSKTQPKPKTSTAHIRVPPSVPRPPKD